MKIIKNFLEEKEIKNLQNNIFNTNFPWFISEILPNKKINNLQMTHSFIKDKKINSDFLYIIDPILKKINAKQILRAKANLNYKTNNIEIGGYHIDQDFYCQSAIFYVNTNNGYTIFKNSKEIVFSEENTMLVFNSTDIHSGTSCTDKIARCVININYYE
jgi:hypothetical protein